MLINGINLALFYIFIIFYNIYIFIILRTLLNINIAFYMNITFHNYYFLFSFNLNSS